MVLDGYLRMQKKKKRRVSMMNTVRAEQKIVVRTVRAEQKIVWFVHRT